MPQTITITNGRPDKHVHVVQYDTDTLELVLNDAVDDENNEFRAHITHLDSVELTIPYVELSRTGENTFDLDLSGVNTSIPGTAFIIIEEVDEETELVVKRHPYAARLVMTIRPVLFPQVPHPFKRLRQWVARVSKADGSDPAIDDVLVNDGFGTPVISFIANSALFTFTEQFIETNAFVRTSHDSVIPASGYSGPPVPNQLIATAWIQSAGVIGCYVRDRDLDLNGSVWDKILIELVVTSSQ